jgi:uncharacterized protein YkwD
VNSHRFFRALLALTSGTFTVVTHAAQALAPTAPSEQKLRRIAELQRARGPVALADLVPLTVDTSSREAVRQFYRSVYLAADGVPIEWTGNTATGVPGTTSAAFKDSVLLRINAVRALAGVPADVTFNDTFSAKAQQAALMMSANNALSHNPPNTWTHWTADGDEAAGSSNLAIGQFGPDAITGYISDAGSNNAAVGHRRWLLYPQTKVMGTGDVPRSGNFSPANATWIFDDNFSAPRPTTRTTYVAWPAEGYFPDSLIFPRWSISYPNANFSGASVTMTRDGAPVPVTLEPITGGVGENTLVWVYNNLDTAEDTPLSVTTDTTFKVTVSGVSIPGLGTQTFTYDVTAFDPDQAGSDTVPTEVTGTSTPNVGVASTYTVVKPAFVDSIDWRLLSFDTNVPAYNAESDLSGVVATTTGSYNPRVTTSVGAGSASYHLAMPDFEDQFLTLPATYHIAAGGSASLSFLSRLGWATAQQNARVQYSLDEGSSWTDLYTQSGTDGGGESSYTNRSVSLGDLAGLTFQIRFAYTHSGGSAFTDTDASVGWLIDNIAFTGAQRVASSTTPASSSDNTFSFTATAPGSYALQARGVFAQQYPMAWGPSFAITVGNNPGGGTGSSRIVDLAARGAVGTGENILIAGVVVGGSPAKPLLIRGVGPSLIPLGVQNALQDPQLSVVNLRTGALLVNNDDWGNDSAISAMEAVVGASPRLAANAKDAAVITVPLGGSDNVFTAAVSGKNNGTGVALAEIYDTDISSGARLVAISARGLVGTGENILIGGFVIVGDAPMRVLIRGVGPTLATTGVQGFLADPQLSVVQWTNNQWVNRGTNNDWGNDASINATSTAVGNGPLLTQDSKDAALILTLEPGVYTAQVSGANGTTGVALVEIYEVP